MRNKENKPKINLPVIIILAILIIIGIIIAIFMDKKPDEEFDSDTTTTTTAESIDPTDDNNSNGNTSGDEGTQVTDENGNVVSGNTNENGDSGNTGDENGNGSSTTDGNGTGDSDSSVVSGTPSATPTPGASATPTTAPTNTPSPTPTPVSYEEYAGYYSRYYDVTNMYHRLAESRGYDIPDPDTTVGASFGLSLSADGYFSISGSTDSAAETLAPLVGNGIYNAAASANASGTYTVNGSSITFYASDGRVVSGSISGNCVSFVTPGEYSIQLALYR